MRLYSNLASSNRGVISVLAIVETLLSVAIYVGVAIWLDTVKHILIAACLAPLWLLRTRGSVRLGLNWYFRLQHSRVWALKWLDPEPLGFLVALIALLILLFITQVEAVLASVAVRCAATVASVGKHPLVHLVAIRKNWKRLVLATDVGTYPEWLPGITKKSGSSAAIGWTPIGSKQKLIVGLVLASTIPLLYLTPLLLRMGIKGVSILYTPLFLVINSDPINQRVDLGIRLIEMQHDNTAKLKRIVATFAIASFSLTLLFSSVVMNLHGLFEPDTSPVLLLLAEYYFPPTLRVWQLASAINGGLTLYLTWLYAPQAARRLERGVWSVQDVRTYLDRWIGLQMALSIFSTICAIAIFANFFLHHQFPPRHWQWFPTVEM